MSKTKLEQALELVHSRGVIAPKDFESRNIPVSYLQRLEQQGILMRSNRGVYTSMEYDVTEKHSLVEVCKRVPNGVICLLSALQFHQLTTQWSWQVWLAIQNKAHRPKIDRPPVQLVYMSGEALTAGVESHKFEGVTVRVTSAAKTVVDCFKFRHKVGQDVAMEALRDYLQQRRYLNEKWGPRSELHHYAKICRVENAMKPYLKAFSIC
ncbi:type IV toxin-antitoxin system AbiEi family antitoxin domain-containing protein [Chroococcidiopsis thermalis]|uniref:Transcriptional regulator-like protein n=1 Tax=Chroococcidiopsis thermalis (strain PCC 7203) TaxID=251229 RepID=K9UA57_CHRTP|nr:type IV toxin-antitoxin system AbiEi family antitoxin domain-containing protein [Chroococcidiopsis thermalis]AFY91129.1 transcriptional regulator-like protein [Chroococcidiopsis thermalis PCC 7203]